MRHLCESLEALGIDTAGFYRLGAVDVVQLTNSVKALQKIYAYSRSIMNNKVTRSLYIYTVYLEVITQLFPYQPIY